MSVEEVDVSALAVAIGRAIDAEKRRNPGITTLHACEALGAVAGTIAGRERPSRAEAHLGAMVSAFAALLAAATRTTGG